MGDRVRDQVKRRSETGGDVDSNLLLFDTALYRSFVVVLYVVLDGRFKAELLNPSIPKAHLKF